MAFAAQTPWQLHIIGPQAVGKMAVGRAVSELTGAPLLHNHVLMDQLKDLFPFGTDRSSRLIDDLRQRIIDEAADAKMNLVLTGTWQFDNPEFLPVFERRAQAVTSRGGDALYLELRAPLAVRLERNRTPFRTAQKNLDWATDQRLTELDGEHRWHSDGDFPFPNHLIIDNANIAAEAAADQTVRHFGLKR